MRLLIILFLALHIKGCNKTETEVDNSQCEYCCDYYEKIKPKKSIFLVAMDKSGSVSNSQLAPIQNFVTNRILEHPSFGFGSKFFITVFASDAKSLTWNDPGYVTPEIALDEKIEKKLKTETTKGCNDAMKFLTERLSKIKIAPSNYLKTSFSAPLIRGLRSNETKVLSVIKSMHEWSEANEQNNAKLITFFVTDFKFSDLRSVQNFLRGKVFKNVTVIQTQPTDNISSAPREKFLNILRAHGVDVVSQ
jgi:hypothetical protein